MKIVLKCWLAAFCLYASNSYGQKTDSHASAAKVIVFLDTECPVSQSYMPVLKKLSEEYREKNVQFESFFPVYTATNKTIQDFLKKYQVTFRGSTDKDHFKTHQYHARVMPEVVLLDKNGIITYQGAIDNWYVALGKNRPKPTEFYLRNAIEAVLNGNPLITPKTEAVGCLIND